jgi:hypothetical protein
VEAWLAIELKETCNHRHAQIWAKDFLECRLQQLRNIPDHDGYSSLEELLVIVSAILLVVAIMRVKSAFSAIPPLLPLGHTLLMDYPQSTRQPNYMQVYPALPHHLPFRWEDVQVGKQTQTKTLLCSCPGMPFPHHIPLEVQRRACSKNSLSLWMSRYVTEMNRIMPGPNTMSGVWTLFGSHT